MIAESSDQSNWNAFHPDRTSVARLSRALSSVILSADPPSVPERILRSDQECQARKFGLQAANGLYESGCCETAHDGRFR
jgi:hypothetical protein